LVTRPSRRRTASTKAGKKPKLERDLQKLCVQWLDLVAKHHSLRYFAIPNGAHLARGAKGYASLKAQGLKAGVPDLCILFGENDPFRRNETLFIELKRPGSSVDLKGDQLEWAGWLNQFGFPSYCTNNFDGFKRIVEKFL